MSTVAAAPASPIPEAKDVAKEATKEVKEATKEPTKEVATETKMTSPAPEVKETNKTPATKLVKKDEESVNEDINCDAPAVPVAKKATNEDTRPLKEIISDSSMPYIQRLMIVIMRNLDASERNLRDKDVVFDYVVRNFAQQPLRVVLESLSNIEFNTDDYLKNRGIRDAFNYILAAYFINNCNHHLVKKFFKKPIPDMPSAKGAHADAESEHEVPSDEPEDDEASRPKASSAIPSASPKQDSWADMAEREDRERLAELAERDERERVESAQSEEREEQEAQERAELIGKLDAAHRFGAASLTLAGLRARYKQQITEPARTKGTLKTTKVTPSAPRKIPQHALDLLEDKTSEVMPEDDGGFVTVSKSKKKEEAMPESMYSQEECKRILGTENANESLRGTKTSACWLIATYCGRPPILPEQHDWYARRVAEDGSPIGWIPTTRTGEPLSEYDRRQLDTATHPYWKATRDAQMFHEFLPDGKLRHFMYNVEYNINTAKREKLIINQVSDLFAIWFYTPKRLRDRIAPNRGRFPPVKF